MLILVEQFLIVMAKKIVFVWMILLAVAGFGQAEVSQDSVENQVNALKQQLDDYEQLLNANHQQRKQDSLVRVDLLTRIQLLQESQNRSQANLKEQIKRDSLSDAIRRAKINELRGKTKAYTVSPLGDSLFCFYTKLGPITANERAVSVSEKIEVLISDDFFYQDSLQTVAQDGTVDVMYGDLIVTSVSDWDVLWLNGADKDSLATHYMETIGTYVNRVRDRSTIQNIIARIGLVFLIIGGVALMLFFLKRLVNGIQGWMVVNKKKYFTGLTIRNYELLPPELHLDAAIRMMSFLKWGMYVLVFYLSLPLIFGLFPFTRSWANTLLDWVLSPAKDIWYGFWGYIPNLITVVVIYFITSYLIKFAKFIATEVENGDLKLPGFYPEWAMPTFRIAKFLIYAFMFVMIYPYLPGSDSIIFKGVAIFIGILIALGSTSAVANAVAGLAITYMRPYRIGDQVKIGEISGEVVGKTLLVTRLRTSKNEDITVPNASILSGHTVNYSSSSRELGLVLHTTVTIGYQVPWRKVHELLIEAAIATEGVNVSREPFVIQKSLDEHSISYQLNAYTDLPDRMTMTLSELHANIQDQFNDAKIEIMSPQYRITREGPKSTISKK